MHGWVDCLGEGGGGMRIGLSGVGIGNKLARRFQLIVLSLLSIVKVYF